MLNICRLSVTTIRLNSTKQKQFYYSRNPGYGANSERDVRRFNVAIERKLARVMAKKFGVDSSVENLKLLLETKTQSRHRKLSAKKQEQLNSLYFETFCSVVNDLDLAKHKIEFIKIEVPTTLLEQVVYWKSTGTEKDVEIERALEEGKMELEAKMSNTLFGSNVPSIRFVADRSHLEVEEMNYLFEIADYGMSYRALSHTGRILGSTADSGKPEPRKNWKEWMEEKKSEKNIE
ncbi:hypothetical protein M3Y94_00804300 [Aphelenchoides besseyi]|nr:hypothetical protein M3Y94_00804300 [Aphelenchoides besseyi]